MPDTNLCLHGLFCGGPSKLANNQSPSQALCTTPGQPFNHISRGVLLRTMKNISAPRSLSKAKVIQKAPDLGGYPSRCQNLDLNPGRGEGSHSNLGKRRRELQIPRHFESSPSAVRTKNTTPTSKPTRSSAATGFSARASAGAPAHSAPLAKAVYAGSSKGPAAAA